MKVKVKIYPKCILSCDGIDYLRSQRNNFKQELLSKKSEIEDLKDILQKDTVISMREENDNLQIVGFQNGDISEAYLYQLDSRSNYSFPRTKSLGVMYLFDRGNKTVALQDWHVRDENCGYGTYFLTSIQQYLRRAGYYSLSGKICPVDYCRLDKLMHLYTKLGFQIKECGEWKSIFCSLREPSEREKERANRLSSAQWLQALEGLAQTDLPQQLRLTSEQFFRLSRHPLFYNELLKCAIEIGKKYKQHWDSITTI